MNVTKGGEAVDEVVMVRCLPRTHTVRLIVSPSIYAGYQALQA